MMRHKNINKHIAIVSALLLTLSSIPFKAFAKENTSTSDPKNITIGAVAKPYIPDYIKLDKNNKPILDEDGNFIFINEKGEEIPSELIDNYTIKANNKGEVIYNLDEVRTSAIQARSTSASVVNLGSTNVIIRSSKSTSSSEVGKIPPNKVATVLQNDNSGWYKVSYKNASGSTKTGYAVKDLLVLVEKTAETKVSNISNASVDIRSSNSTNASTLGSLPKGGTAYAVDRKNGWIRIVYNDICGWVSESLVKFSNTSSSKNTTLKSSGIVDSVYAKNKTNNVNIKTSSYMKDSNDRQFYCMDPEKYAPNGHIYYRGKQLDDGAYRIVKNGYPNKSFTGDNLTDRIITQIAFWAYVDKTLVDINNIEMINNGKTDSNLLKTVKSLYNKSTSATNTQEVSVQFSNTKLTANFKNNAFETDYITLVGKGDIKSAKTTLTFTDNSTKSEIKDIKIVGEDNKKLSSISLGQKFKIVIPSTIAAGDITVTGTSVIDHEVIMLYSSNLAGIQDSAGLEIIQESKELTNKLNVSWKGIGDLSITKTDADTKSKLSGAQFTITDSTGKVVETLTTDKNGYAKSKELPFGTYKVQETKAPTGYVLDNTVHTVTLNQTSTLELNYTNKPITGSVSIKKVDSTDENKVLQGAEFTLYSKDGKEISKATTDSTGIAKFENLGYGEYSIKETKAPIGYELDSKTVHNVNITTNNKTHEIKATNKPITGSVSIKKVDSTNENKVLEGAEFTLYSKDGKEISKATTDSTGIAKFENLQHGEYSIKETKAPIGYELDSKTVHNVNITANSKTHEIKATNKPITGSVSIKKVDSADENIVLQGAEFTLYSKDGKEISKATTDSTGIAKFENLGYGEYSIKETKAPTGYELDSKTTHKVNITENGKVYKIKATNNTIKGSVSIKKVDSTNENIVLQGAEFTLYSKDGKEISKATTDSTGIAKFENLQHGEYSIKETKAPIGYELDSKTVHNVNITANSKTHEIKATNKPITGSVSIKKVDSADENKVLEGAEFTLYSKDGKEISKATTDSTGIAKFENLQHGEYSIKETKAPIGYELDSKTVHSVNITANSKTHEIKATNNAIKGSVSIKKVDSADENKVLEGAEFTLYSKDGKEISKATTDSTGIAKFENLEYGEYSIKETNAPNGYELDSTTIHNVNVTENGKVYEIKATNKLITGSVTVKKVDSADENKVLQGAEFTLYTKDGQEISKATTDSTGIAKFENLTIGEYYIKETIAPDEYVITDDIKNFQITSTEKEFSFTIQNTKISGELDFSKTDVSTGDIIEGATIEITGLSESNNHINFSFISSKEGNKFKLPVGKYEFKETIAPEGYVLSTEVGTFEIKANGEIIKAELKNKPILGNVKVLKVDSEDNSKLTGAEFTLYDENKKEVSKLEVDKDGVALFENLRAGKYSLAETKAPEGYQLIDNPIELTISKDQETIELTVKNTKTAGEVDFSKIDVSTGELLEGATIEINGLDESNKHIKISFVSSKDGNRFKLPLGKYEFKETAAPEGYVLSTEVGTFEIKAHGEIVKAQLENRPISGSIKVLKVDSKTEKALTGAEFTLYDKNGKEISKLEVDKDGIALFKHLPLGEYSIKETKAPTNYQISDKAFKAKITEDGQVVEITVKNDAKLAQTDGDFTFNQLIFTGSALLIVGLLLLQTNKGGKFDE